MDVPCEVGFYAGGAETRTEMLSDGLSAVWVPGDEIAVWARSSSGAYVLSNQVFKTYGLDGSLGYFTSTLNSPMPSGNYTYFCCYPVPTSISGTTARFTIPSVQDGKVTGGTDIMVATPIQGPALRSINNEEPQNDMSMVMNRMTHQFRFWIPTGMNGLGEEVEKIEITMPDKIVGELVTDLSSPLTYMDIANGSNTVTLDLSNPLGESDFETDPEFACAAVFAADEVYSPSDFMKITVYSNSGKSVLDPIPLEGRRFQAGHSTPVRLLPKEPSIYCSVRIRTGHNYIGEPLWNIRISSGGETLFTYSNTAGTYHNIEHLQEYNGVSGKKSYDALVDAVANGKAVLNFETQHASVDIPMTKDMMAHNGNSAVLNLGDVPYLLYEDFSSAKNYAKDNKYSGSIDSDTNNKGYLLDGYLPNAGWNASRFELIEGDCININCRFEGWAATFSRYCGRFDTPALKWIKPNTSAEIILEFDRAFYVPVGYNMDDSSIPHARYKVGYHTKSQSSAINGVNSNSVNSSATIVKTSGLYKSENIGAMTHESLNITSVTNQTRIVFFADTDRTKPDKSAFLGNNSCYYLYLDNIKIYFAK